MHVVQLFKMLFDTCSLELSNYFEQMEYQLRNVGKTEKDIKRTILHKIR